MHCIDLMSLKRGTESNLGIDVTFELSTTQLQVRKAKRCLNSWHCKLIPTDGRTLGGSLCRTQSIDMSASKSCWCNSFNGTTARRGCRIVQFSLSVDFCVLRVIDFPLNFPAGGPTQGGGIRIVDWETWKIWLSYCDGGHHYSPGDYFYLVGRLSRVIEGGIFSMLSCLIKNGSLHISVTGSYNRFFMVLNHRCPIHMAGFHSHP